MTHAIESGNGSSTPWIMVETLDPAIEPTVVSTGDGEKDFVALSRVVQRAINSARLGASVTAAEVCQPITAARDRREPVNAMFGQGRSRRVLHARPVFGPEQHVHGVQYWFGPTDQDPPAPRRAAGVVWDLPAKVVRMTIDCTRMAGIPDTKFLPVLPLAMFWHNAERFDHHEEVYNLLYESGPKAKLRTCGTVRNVARQSEMYWQATIRARKDSQAIGAWGLLEDLTSMKSRPPRATLEQKTFRDYLRANDAYLGIIHVPDGSVVRWLTDPPPWIDWTRAPNEVFPPEDRARLMKATAPDDGIVRAINHDNSYIPTRIVLTPYRGRQNNRLAICRFLRADNSSERNLRSA